MHVYNNVYTVGTLCKILYRIVGLSSSRTESVEPINRRRAHDRWREVAWPGRVGCVSAADDDSGSGAGCRLLRVVAGRSPLPATVVSAARAAVPAYLYRLYIIILIIITVILMLCIIIIVIRYTVFFYHYFPGPRRYIAFYHRSASSWCYRFTIFASVSQRYTRVLDETRSIFFFNTQVVYLLYYWGCVYRYIWFNNIVNIYICVPGRT